MDQVRYYQANTWIPEVEKAWARADAESKRQTLSNMRNKLEIKTTLIEAASSLADFYNSYDPHAVTPLDKQSYQVYQQSLSADENAVLDTGLNYYVREFSNNGGVVVPIIVQIEFEDGTREVLRFPAEIWRMNDERVSKIIPTTKKVTSFTLDPFFETADINTENNSFPRKPVPNRFQLYKQKQSAQPNPMQQNNTKPPTNGAEQTQPGE